MKKNPTNQGHSNQIPLDRCTSACMQHDNTICQHHNKTMLCHLTHMQYTCFRGSNRGMPDPFFPCSPLALLRISKVPIQNCGPQKQVVLPGKFQKSFMTSLQVLVKNIYRLNYQIPKILSSAQICPLLWDFYSIQSQNTHSQQWPIRKDYKFGVHFSLNH